MLPKLAGIPELGRDLVRWLWSVLPTYILRSLSLKKILFIYFWPHWVFVTVPGLSPFVVTGGCSVAVHGLLVAVATLGLCYHAWAFPICGDRGLLCCSAWTSRCSGSSCCGARSLGCMGSVVVAHGFSCPEACGILLDHGSNFCPVPW